jgi:hypothetical protein
MILPTGNESGLAGMAAAVVVSSETVAALFEVFLLPHAIVNNKIFRKIIRKSFIGNCHK